MVKFCKIQYQLTHFGNQTYFIFNSVFINGIQEIALHSMLDQW